MQMKNLKVEELSSQEMKNVEGGIFPLIVGAFAGLSYVFSYVGASLAVAGVAGLASGVADWGLTQYMGW
ncbi:class IIb bacteriocin, lactobin A/cerein 7B family [Chryseobacterium nematophagum]|nr:class IIb bacteriocin, lactobin A/cerein 7B family [Chryseobacterium nematophagum]